MANAIGATSAGAGARILETFHDKLRNEWTMEAYCGRKYYRTNDIVAWMRDTDTNQPNPNAGLLLASAYAEHSVHHYSSEKIMSGESQCLIVFAILLELDHGYLVEDFQRYNIIDNRLPEPTSSSIEQLISHLNNKRVQSSKELWDRFEEKMWMYRPCALELDMRKAFLDPCYGRWIMPFCRRQSINMKGATAQVCEVAIQEFLVCPELAKLVESSKYTDNTYKTCYTFALKTFTQESKKVFEWERKAYLAMQGKPELQLPGMVRYLGEYEIDQQIDDGSVVRTWNILLEYGEADLEEFFAAPENHPPTLNLETARFWNSLANVAKALDRLHNLKLEREDGHQDSFSGWHSDLKPDNILRVDGEFKLADFGFATFQPTDSRSFPLRRRIAGGTETYGAPECDLARKDPSRQVSQAIDTWSLGCVLSVSATWVILGYQGVRAYHRHRRIAIRKLKDKRARDKSISVPAADDAFHNGVEVLPEVREWHEFLRDSLRKSDTSTGRILDLIDESMLVTESARQSKVKGIYEAIQDQLRLAEDDYRILLNNFSVKPTPESVKEALLSVESEEENSFYNVQETEIVAIEAEDLLDIPVQGHQVISGRAGKKEKMDKVVPGKVAHRQEALQLDAKQLNGRPLEPKSSIGDSSESNPYAESSGDPGSLGPLLGPTQPPGFHPHHITIPEKEVITPDPIWLPTISPMGGNPVLPSERLPTSRPLSQYNPNPAWPICKEHQIQKSKGKGIRAIFRKNVDDYLKNFLVDRDIMFLVDNDTTMSPYWDAMTVVLETLVYMVDALDKDGLDLEFTIGEEHNASGVRKNRLLSRFESAKQGALSRRYDIGTDMVKTLNRIFDKYLHDTRRGMTLIILTDGIWKGTFESKGVERAIAEFLKKPALAHRLEKRWFTIQFIPFGHEIPNILKHLDDGIEEEYHIPDVVDVEHVSGDVYKMILGSLVSKIDATELSSASPASPMSPSHLAPPFTMEASPPTFGPVTRRDTTWSSRSFKNRFFR